jgi:hypothetical protein
VTATLAPLAVMTPGHAAPGGGAQRYSFPTECTTPQAPVQECSSVTGRFNNTTTPSGNFTAIDVQTRTFEVTSPFTESGTVRIHYRLLEKDGQVQVENTSFRVRSVLNGERCAGREHTLIVKGEVRRQTEPVLC